MKLNLKFTLSVIVILCFGTWRTAGLTPGGMSKVGSTKILNNMILYLRGNSSDILEDDEYTVVDYIRRRSDLHCGQQETDIVKIELLKRLDSRIDFPMYDGASSDYLRSRVLRCLEFKERNVTVEWTLRTLWKKAAIRAAIDYNVGFFLSRELEVDVGHINNMFGGSASYMTRKDLNIFKRRIDVKRSNYSRELFFVNPMSIMLQQVLISRGEVHHATEIVIDGQKIAMMGTMIGGMSSLLSIVSNLISLTSSTSTASDIILMRIEMGVLESHKIELESRKKYLESMLLILKSSQQSNKILVEISNKLTNILTVLEELTDKIDDIQLELEKVNVNLDEISSKLDEINNRLAMADKPRTDSVNDVGKDIDNLLNYDKEPKLLSHIKELYTDYTNLDCESLEDFILTYRNNCVFMFFIDRKLNLISDTDYYRFRFDNSIDVHGYRGMGSTYCYRYGGHSPNFEHIINDLESKYSKDNDIKGDRMHDYLTELRLISRFLMKDIDMNYDKSILTTIYGIYSYLDYNLESRGSEEILMKIVSSDICL